MRKARAKEPPPIARGLRRQSRAASARREGLKAKIWLEGNARQDARVEVLAALGVLHQDAGPIAVTALRGRLGAEVDRPRGETAVILDIGERIADRGAIGLE